MGGILNDAPATRQAASTELSSRQLGHSSSQVDRARDNAKPPFSADLSELLEPPAESADASYFLARGEEAQIEQAGRSGRTP